MLYETLYMISLVEKAITSGHVSITDPKDSSNKPTENEFYATTRHLNSFKKSGAAEEKHPTDGLNFEIQMEIYLNRLHPSIDHWVYQKIEGEMLWKDFSVRELCVHFLLMNILGLESRAESRIFIFFRFPLPWSNKNRNEARNIKQNQPEWTQTFTEWVESSGGKFYARN